ncbi:Uncharacterised protein [Klebsiella pneumoniae]|nr:Uncharacterised protein [Klebsiella pneumoniae]
MFQPKLHPLGDAQQRRPPAQQTVRLHLLQPAGQVHAAAPQIDLHALRLLALGHHPLGQRLHLQALRLPDQLAKGAIRQLAGGAKAAEHSRDVLLLNKRIEQLLIQLITAQPFKSERLVVWNIVLFGAEIDPQTLLKERAYRVLPEAQKLIERQAVNRRRGERLYKIAMRLSLLAGGRQPFTSVALVLVFLEIGNVERHARMQMGDVGFNPRFAGVAVKLFVTGETVALADIIHQLLHQHRRKTLAVVLDRTADIADIQRLLGGHQRFEEQIAVIIAPAAVAALRLLAH